MSFLAALAPSILGLGGSLGGGALARQKTQETPIQKQQRQLIDELLASIGGQGQYSNLFNMDDEAFQRSYVDPMKRMFNTQIAPQIQQSYIQSGQQRGTGMENALTRAGVDLDSMINQYYSQAMENAQNRQMNALSGIMGMGAGATPGQSMGQAMGQGITGFLSGEGFPKSMDTLLNYYNNRKGFTKDNPTASTASGVTAGGTQ